MIDQRINDSLKELEKNLQAIESSKQQVENTIKSYKGLKDATSDYVVKLSDLTLKVKGLIKTIDEDYSNKLKDLEADRKSIVENANKATKQLSEATDSLQNSFRGFEFKLMISLILNISVFGILFYDLMK